MSLCSPPGRAGRFRPRPRPPAAQPGWRSPAPARSRPAATRPTTARRSRGPAAPARTRCEAPDRWPELDLLWSFGSPGVVVGGAGALAGYHGGPQRTAWGARAAVGWALQRGPRPGQDLPGDAIRMLGRLHPGHSESLFRVECRVPGGEGEPTGGDGPDAAPGPVGELEHFLDALLGGGIAGTTHRAGVLVFYLGLALL